MAVTVRTEDGSNDNPFVEETRTLVVNLHGALIALSSKVTKNQTLRLINRATQEEQRCRVIYSQATPEGETHVGVEFLNPSPDFWRIAFPPEDWVLPDPSSTL
jgi:hypothetical protein